MSLVTPVVVFFAVNPDEELTSEDIASIERRMIWVSDWDALVEVHEGGRCMPGRTAKLGVEI